MTPITLDWRRRATWPAADVPAGVVEVLLPSSAWCDDRLVVLARALRVLGRDSRFAPGRLRRPAVLTVLACQDRA